MSMNKYIASMALVGSLFLLASCEKEPLVPYHGGNFVSFQKHNSYISFLGYTYEAKPLDTLVVELAIGGDMADYDRYVTGVVVEDSVGVKDEERRTTATPDEYRILGGVVKAGEVYGKFGIELVNSDRLLDEDLKVCIRLIPSDDFELGLRPNVEMDITWVRRLVKPATWERMRTFFCDQYSTIVYQTIIKVTGLSEIPIGMAHEELRVLGRKFGDYVRAYNEEHGTPMVHDDGDDKGTIVRPMY